MKRSAKIAVWLGGVVGVVIIAVLSVAAWVLFTTAGARWVAGMVTSRFAPQVSYAALDGTLAGELEVRDFRFAGAADTAQIRVARLTIDPTLSMLVSRVLRIERATVTGLVLTLPEQPKPDDGSPLWIEPPLEVEVADFTLVDGVVSKARERVAAVKRVGVSARWSREELIIDRLDVLPADVSGNLAVHGRVVPEGRTVQARLSAAWRDVVIPASLAGRELATHGSLTLEGTPQRYAVTSQGAAGPRGDLTRFALAVNGTDQSAVIRKLELEQRAGRFEVTGDVGFAPVAWDLRVLARGFDPGALLANWNGRVDLDLATHGQMRDAGPAGRVEIAKLSGVLRGRPLAGGGALDFAAPSQLAGDLRVSSGRSRVSVQGRGAGEQRVDATVDLAIASLGDWIPDARGSLAGQFRVRGQWPKLAIAGAAEGRQLGVGESRVARLHVRADVASPLAPSGELRASAEGVAAGGLAFTSATVEASGNQARHRVTARVNGERLKSAVTLAGGLQGTNWRGMLERLDLASPNIADLSLQAPAALSFATSGTFSLAPACLVEGARKLCVGGSLAADQAVAANFSFEHVPLSLANAFVPDALPGELRGELAGRGQLHRGVDGQWKGDARVTSPSATLVMAQGASAAPALTAGEFVIYENLEVAATLEGMTARGTLAAGLEHGGNLKAAFDASDLVAAAPRISGRVDVTMPTLAPFGAFVPTVANVDGAVDAHVEISGTTAAPALTGNVAATKLQADLGELGIELREGTLRAEALRDGGFSLAGGMKSGAGRVDVEGTLSARGLLDARIRGKNFVAANLPVANVVITPDLTLRGDPKRYLLEGDVAIPRADINIQKMPQDRPPGASPDVVVVRNGREVARAEESAGLPLEANVNVLLGEKIAVTGYGLDATVLGQLRVHEAPGAPTTGSGTLDVSGTYKAYGQDLTIKDGRLLFAGTPLDDPRLSIVAMRAINDDLSTGLRIAGSAQRPLITVISDPNVGEADALSYLVTGRSLNEVGSASGSSQDTLASATRSLEGGAAGLVAKRIGQRLGLDEASVEENEMIGGSALTIGEYLSPRLYLSYGVGLFQPGEVIALKYRLSKGVDARIQRGSEETRAGVEYRIER